MPWFCIPFRNYPFTWRILFYLFTFPQIVEPSQYITISTANCISFLNFVPTFLFVAACKSSWTSRDFWRRARRSIVGASLVAKKDCEPGLEVSIYYSICVGLYINFSLSLSLCIYSLSWGVGDINVGLVPLNCICIISWRKPWVKLKTCTRLWSDSKIVAPE